jgi:hypothetical protein
MRSLQAVIEIGIDPYNLLKRDHRNLARAP